MKKLVIILCLIFIVFVDKCYFYEPAVEHIKIGGLFDEASGDPAVAFEFAVDAVNNQREDAFEPMFEGTIQELKYGDQFEASKKLCKILKQGVWALMGPSSPDVGEHMQSVCDAKDMPLIERRYNPESKMPVINLYPFPEALEKAYLDLVKAWDWQGFTILYENGPWLPPMEKLMKYFDSKTNVVTIRQLKVPKDDPTNFRQVLQRVKSEGDKNIIISCSVEILPDVMQQAQQVGILTEHHQYIITTLDMHTIDLYPYQHGGTNITGMRLIDPESKFVQDTTEFFRMQLEEKSQEPRDGLTAKLLRVESALTYDAVLLFAETIRKHKDHESITSQPLKCEQVNSTWSFGTTISTFMKDVEVEGLTGHIKFDHQGQRSEFKLELYELQSDGIHDIGTWNYTSGLNINRYQPPSASGHADLPLANQSFIVLTALSNPYGMLRDTIQKLEGNDRFEGFGIELIEELSRMLGFNYTFVLQEDKKYGSLDKQTGEWNGMIKEIMEGRADLAITDLTITSDRESAVDFTMPFMNLGISILFQKPKKESPKMFSFMSPFSDEVWLFLGGAFFLVSCSFFILSRLSPAEWDNPYPCIQEPEFLENQFSFRNSMWFTIGALLQQGSELAPKAPCTRAVASMWWFFTLIMVSSYTANLAAFLTIESTTQSFKDVEGLAGLNGKIPYGAKKGGSTLSFFNDSDSATYKKMFKWMMDHPEYLTSSNEEGEMKAIQGNYAFLMESSSIDFIVERKCTVCRVGGLLDSKGYGIAMRKNSKYRAKLSEAVLQLQENGKLSQMQIKWWKEKRGGGACSGTDDEGGAEELQMANVGGVFVSLIGGSIVAVIVAVFEMVSAVRDRAKELQGTAPEGASKLNISNVLGIFVVLGVGCSIATAIACIEFYYRVYRQAKELKVPFKEELMEEIRFVTKCSGNTRVIRRRKSSSQDSLEISRSRSRSRF